MKKTIVKLLKNIIEEAEENKSVATYQKNEKPIMQVVLEYLSEHESVDEDFMIEPDEGLIKMLAGGQDRMMLMFNDDVELDQETVDKFADMIFSIDDHEHMKAFILLDQVTRAYPAVFFKKYWDIIANRVQSSEAITDQKALQTFLLKYIAVVSDPENMKLLILLCSLLQEVPADLKDMLMVLIRVPEFTSYFEYCIKLMPEVNEQLFQYAKVSSGYAKVDLIRLIEPSTEEIRNWMMTDGYDPFLAWHYTVGYIAKKCDVYHLLKKEDLTENEYSMIGNVIGAYFSEGIAEGLLDYEFWFESIMEYLRIGQEKPSEAYIRVLLSLQNSLSFFRRPLWEKIADIYNRCEELLKDPGLIDSIRKLNQKGKAFYADEAFGIEAGDVYLSWLEKDYLKYMNCYDCLGNNLADKLRYTEILLEKLKQVSDEQNEDSENLATRIIYLCLSAMENEPEQRLMLYRKAEELGILHDLVMNFICDLGVQMEENHCLSEEYEAMRNRLLNDDCVTEYYKDMLENPNMEPDYNFYS